jgi:hypothetical protein
MTCPLRIPLVATTRCLSVCGFGVGWSTLAPAPHLSLASPPLVITAQHRCPLGQEATRQNPIARQQGLQGPLPAPATPHLSCRVRAHHWHPPRCQPPHPCVGYLPATILLPLSVCLYKGTQCHLYDPPPRRLFLPPVSHCHVFPISTAAAHYGQLSLSAFLHHARVPKLSRVSELLSKPTPTPHHHWSAAKPPSR